MRFTQEQLDAAVARISERLSRPAPNRAKADTAKKAGMSPALASRADAASSPTPWQPAPWLDDKAPVVGICRAAGLPVPVTEFAFHPGRRWRFDYAWPAEKLALEIEGGIWRKGGGAHSHPTNILRDLEKYSEAAILGWRILRVTTDELRNNVALDRIERAFRVAA